MIGPGTGAGEAADARLEPLLEQISDGAAIDWEAVGMELPGLGRQIASLRRIRAIQEQFREQREDIQPRNFGRVLLFRWGHLQVVEALGEGSFGTVFRAYDELLDRDVALKLRRSGASASLFDTSSFIEEARRLARVRHPNVLAVHGAGTHDGRVGLWADLLEGQTLAASLRAQGPLALPEVRRCALDLAAALEAIHAAGIIHGDVKASNAIVEPDGRVVLMDFGAGAWLDDQSGAGHMVHGSPLHMAPEVLEGEAQSAASDIYALGVVLFGALTGTYPVSGDSLDSIRKAHAAGHRRSLAALRPDAPRSLVELIESLLGRDRGRRPSAASVVARLRWIEGAPERRRRRRAVVAVIASLGLALVVSLAALHRVTVAGAQVREEFLRAESERARAEEEREMALAVKNFLVEGVQKSAPIRQQGEASIGAMLKLMAEMLDARLSAHPEALADMRVIIGRGLFEFGDRERGLALTEKGVSAYDDLPEASAIIKASSLQVLALMYRQEGRPDDAERTARLALQHAARDDSGVDQTPFVLMVRGILANALGDRGRYLDSAQEWEVVLAARAKHYGADSPRLAADYNNLGAAYAKLERWSDSLEAYTAAERLLGGAGTGVSIRHAMLRQGRGIALLGLDRLDEAEAQLHSAKEIFLGAFGADHAHVRAVDSILAELRFRRGDALGAARAFEEVIAGLGDDANTYLRLRYVRTLIVLERWSDAVAQIELAGNAAGTEYAIHVDYMHALTQWCEHRLERRPDPPVAESRRAIQTYESAGMGHSFGATLLRELVAGVAEGKGVAAR